MTEPTVGMKYGNYTASMENLASKYKRRRNYTLGGYIVNSNTFYDKNNKEVATFGYSSEVTTTNKYPKGSIRSLMPDSIITTEKSASYYIQTPKYWGDDTLRWSGSSENGQPHNFTKIEGYKTYAQDGAVNPNYKPKPGERPTNMKDGIVQPWEIFTK